MHDYANNRRCQRRRHEGRTGDTAGGAPANRELGMVAEPETPRHPPAIRRLGPGGFVRQQ
jgi:hypothetical protein